MLRIVHPVLCATRRKNLLCIAAAVLPLVVILTLLEISYREELAREPSQTLTASLPSSPPVSPPKLEFESDDLRWTPLAEPIVPLAPPSLAAEVKSSSTEPTQTSTQGAVLSRDPVPLPRSRPNRL